MWACRLNVLQKKFPVPRIPNVTKKDSSFTVRLIILGVFLFVGGDYFWYEEAFNALDPDLWSETVQPGSW